MVDFQVLRKAMIEGQIRPCRVKDPLLLNAFGKIPRERFVPDFLQNLAYGDDQIFFPNGRFMLQPMVLARLIASLALKPKDKVLVIGCTTGYSLAILKDLAGAVFGLESDVQLADQAINILKGLRKSPNAVLKSGLSEGAPQTSPYQAILIEGGGQKLPDSLLMQLAESGRLAYISSINERIGQATLLTKQNGTISKRSLFDCAPCLLPDFASQGAFIF